MIQIDRTRTPADLLPHINRLFDLSGGKIRALEQSWSPASGAPVFTVEGRYTARGWTEWTEGFQYGSALLQFDATGDPEFLDLGRERTLARMAPHLTHTGVHDHGFNNVSTYGALWRMARERRIDASQWEIRFYELALKVSGAIQARRWTTLPDGGFIYSFNGAHSLFVDTIRSLRALAIAHRLGHRLVEEQDAQVNLLARLVQHARATATYNVFDGRTNGPYDVRGRVAHESLFNAANGTYRGPSTQQGYSPFSTWTRGLAWAMLGFAEEIEFIATIPASDLQEAGGGDAMGWMLEAARATCDFYARYWQAGLRVAETLFDPSSPYLSQAEEHQGLLLHSVYHWPNGWDHVPKGSRVPRGESSQWGDYHARELALYLLRCAQDRPYLTFFGPALAGSEDPALQRGFGDPALQRGFGDPALQRGFEEPAPRPSGHSS
jgi:unsaturated chondroitin disaccharide hydrolase